MAGSSRSAALPRARSRRGPRPSAHTCPHRPQRRSARSSPNPRAPDGPPPRSSLAPSLWGTVIEAGGLAPEGFQRGEQVGAVLGGDAGDQFGLERLDDRAGLGKGFAAVRGQVEAARFL